MADRPHQEEGCPDSEGDKEVMSRSRKAGSLHPFPKMFDQELIDEWEELIHSKLQVAQSVSLGWVQCSL